MAVDPDTQRIKRHVFPRGQSKANDRTIKWGHRSSRSEATRGQEEMWKTILEDHITQCLDTGLELSKKTTLGCCGAFPEATSSISGCSQNQEENKTYLLGHVALKKTQLSRHDNHHTKCVDIFHGSPEGPSRGI